MAIIISDATRRVCAVLSINRFPARTGLTNNQTITLCQRARSRVCVFLFERHGAADGFEEIEMESNGC